MSTKSIFIVISMTISMISYMPKYVQAGTCKEDLNAFGYDGKLDHDTYPFNIGTVEKTNKWIPGYRRFMNYIDDKVFSTNTELVELYCAVAEKLFNQGFTGALPIDKLLTENKDNDALVKEYIAFINGEPYSGFTDKKSQFVFDLVYEFVVQKKITPTDEGKPCKNTLQKLSYNGNLVHDFLALRKRGRTEIPASIKLNESEKTLIENYHKFMYHVKPYVFLTDISIKDVYCDLIAPLDTHGFNGTRDHDLKLIEELNKDENHVLKEEANIYKGYLDRVKIDVYEAAGLIIPSNFLNRLGIHKLGKIMY